MITELDNVSNGSWSPVLFIDRPYFTNGDGSPPPDDYASYCNTGSIPGCLPPQDPHYPYEHLTHSLGVDPVDVGSYSSALSISMPLLM